MNVFIILSILIIVTGVLLMVATPSVLFKFNLLVYQLNVVQKNKRKQTDCVDYLINAIDN